MTAQYQFSPWVRAGATNVFTNPDNVLDAILSRNDGKPLPNFPVRLKINTSTNVDVALRMLGPGDVTGIDPRVVIRVDPPRFSADCEPNYLACIEFDPPDFPWLFTPAAAGAKGRIRPWLVLVLVKPGEEVRLESMPGQPLPVLTTPVRELPDLLESYLWAHAQVIQSEESESVEHVLKDLPNQNLSRLICPRRLEPTTHYLACLVPAFAAGCKAGLGEDVTPADQDTLAPAWDAAQAQQQVRLPVYYHWEFRTGSGGDFESLADRLKGRPALANIGRRPLRVTEQPFGLPDLGRLTMEGALISTQDAPATEVDASFREELRNLLNLSAEQPVVTPPIYGHWQAAQTSVPGEGQPPTWLAQLNLDPSRRALAGFGARVVQERQEQLIASAWEQLGEGRTVSQLERRLEVAVALLGSVVRRRVNLMEPAQLVQFLGPAMTRMRASPETLRASLSRQGLPSAYSSPTLRRALRPVATLSRKNDLPKPLSLQVVASKMSTKVPAVNPTAGTKGLVSLSVVKAVKITGQLSPAQLRYREAVIATQTFFDRFSGTGVPIPSPAFAFTAALKTNLVNSLAPDVTAPKRFYARISTSSVPVTPPTKPGESVIPGPVFPQPMYEALRDLSPDYLLPGIEQIQPDTVTLLKSNSTAIEAFMLGLNEEMANEAVWRELPGDLRHTYFSVFWDTRGSLETISQLPDIHTWVSASNLGSHFGLGGSQLVLLICGELLQRYPDALIYAIRAATDDTLGTEQKFPLFRGRIEPNITFLGFDLTAPQARGGTTDHGWFFAIQEQPSAPRFGMDEERTKPLKSWNDLGWTDVSTKPGAHLQAKDLLSQPPPGPAWGFNAAHMAAILRQRPVRVAMHARYLLPPGPGLDGPQPVPHPVPPVDPIPPVINP